MPEALIPIMFFLCTAGVIVFAILSRHKERITMLEKGLSAEDIKSIYERTSGGKIQPLTSLKWGMILACIGLGILIAMFLRDHYFLDEGIYPAVVALFGGIALIGFYAISSRKLGQS